jgi:diaminopimelate epimerase
VLPDRVPFIKLHGAGNDYLFVELEDASPEVAEALVAAGPRLARHLSPRRTAVGADGIVFVLPDEQADARLVMFNADGSRGRLCGNALRLVAWRLFEGARKGAPEVLLASDAGLHPARPGRDPEGRPEPRVALGRPRFDAAAIPFEPSAVRVFQEGGPEGPWQVGVEAGASAWEGLVLSVGNPHLVLPLALDPHELDLTVLGPPLENHAAFPERVNVNFLLVDERGVLHLRTFERGSGETSACGSGAAASAVALSHLLGLERDLPLRVRMAGGELIVHYGADGMVWVAGPVAEAFRGSFLSSLGEDGVRLVP